MTHMVEVSTWPSCYSASWKGLIVDEAFSHPAKYSRSLIARIYTHAKAEGWVTPGCWILDPFAGVSLGAMDALAQGYNVVHCELEPKFHALAQANVARWARQRGHLPGYGQAVLLQGDSRHLGGLVQAQGDVCVSSPPYADGCTHTGGADPHPEHVQGGHVRHVAYGSEGGQLGTLGPGAVEACISSPAYATGLGHACTYRDPAKAHQDATRDIMAAKGGKAADMQYGTTDGQLGQTQGDTFWGASKAILEQVFHVLRPGGHAIFVVKNYIRNGAEVDFTGDWARLTQHCGFEWMHHHQALLVETHGTQRDLFGVDHVHETRRESFFRRLARKKTGLAIEYESVLCFRKPLASVPLPPEEPQGPYALDMALSSPPYAGAGEVLGTHNGIDWHKTTGTGRRLTPGREMGIYGTTSGQLGMMQPGDHPS